MKDKLTIEDIEAKIVEEHFTHYDNKNTVCCLKLQNGFQVFGTSGVINPANFDAAIGRKIAREHAVDQVWLIEGYLLQQRLWIEKLRNEAHAGRPDDYPLTPDEAFPNPNQ